MTMALQPHSSCEPVPAAARPMPGLITTGSHHGRNRFLHHRHFHSGLDGADAPFGSRFGVSYPYRRPHLGASGAGFCCASRHLGDQLWRHPPFAGQAAASAQRLWPCHPAWSTSVAGARAQQRPVAGGSRQEQPANPQAQGKGSPHNQHHLVPSLAARRRAVASTRPSMAVALASHGQGGRQGLQGASCRPGRWLHPPPLVELLLLRLLGQPPVLLECRQQTWQRLRQHLPL
mmetsp:Transcript_133158/g.259247  ORF Transcript_133158/g.259247 Transcript_133158/m.259247 type:complete len:232 (+) Transcript_133158:98-793(+)